MARFRMKSGSASMIIGGVRRECHPGDVVEAAYGEIPEAFLDQWEALDPPPPPPEEAPPPPQAQLIVEPVAGKADKYNVVNPATGKKLNTKGLSLADARALAGYPLDGEE